MHSYSNYYVTSFPRSLRAYPSPLLASPFLLLPPFLLLCCSLQFLAKRFSGPLPPHQFRPEERHLAPRRSLRLLRPATGNRLLLGFLLFRCCCPNLLSGVQPRAQQPPAGNLFSHLLQTKV